MNTWNDPLEQILQHFKYKPESLPKPHLFRFSFELFFAAAGKNGYILELKVKAGSKRLQVVAQPLLLFQAICKGQSFTISKSNVYDPLEYDIAVPEREVIESIAKFCQDERSQQTIYYDSVIEIPSSWWASIREPLQKCQQVVLDYEQPQLPILEQKSTVEKFKLRTNCKLPVAVTIQNDGFNYSLSSPDFSKLLLLPSFELALFETEMFQIDYASASELNKIKQLFIQSNSQVTIKNEQLNRFVQLLIPFMNQWFTIHISEQIAEMLIDQPLTAHIFLDRVSEKILAGIEFHYGSLIVHPFAASQNTQLERIIIRRHSEEMKLLQFFEQMTALRTENGYIIEGEELEYEFLYELLPELAKLATIHATQAIKVRYLQEEQYPTIHLDWNEKNNWLEYHFQMDGISEQEIKACIQALVKKKKYYVLSNGAILSLKQGPFQSLIRVMQQLGLTHPIHFDERIPLYRAIPLCNVLSEEQVLQTSASLRQLLEQMQYAANQKQPLPAAFTGALRQYQETGYQWLALLAQFEIGGILADEMGLGKTIQAIAFLAHRLEQQKQLSSLVVAPTSLIYNWLHEWQAFAPSIKVQLLETKQQIEAAVGNATMSAIYIVSYPMLREHYKPFAKLEFDSVIFDEAQNFKNDYTQTAKAVKVINARHRFALTGTPLENKRDELFTLLNVLNPQLFADKMSYQFWTNEQLTAAIRPFILRRKKQEVLKELPNKIETIYTAPLEQEQRKLYASYLARLQEDTFKHLDPKHLQEEKNRIRILAGITRLRQICCHPSLFVENYLGKSAKLEQLLQLVDQQYREGKRMLIFSQFTSMLQIIQGELARRGYRFFYLDGQTDPELRVQYCERFNAGEKDIFLLSLKAGGTGLNLTGANTVILYDLWWNPAVEQQATDRAHRIGQQKNVHIFKLVAEGTIEEKMIELQHKKRQLIDTIIDHGEQTEEKLNINELMALISTPIKP